MGTTPYSYVVRLESWGEYFVRRETAIATEQVERRTGRLNLRLLCMPSARSCHHVITRAENGAVIVKRYIIKGGYAPLLRAPQELHTKTPTSRYTKSRGGCFWVRKRCYILLYDRIEIPGQGPRMKTHEDRCWKSFETCRTQFFLRPGADSSRDQHAEWPFRGRNCKYPGNKGAKRQCGSSYRRRKSSAD